MNINEGKSQVKHLPQSPVSTLILAFIGLPIHYRALALNFRKRRSLLAWYEAFIVQIGRTCYLGVKLLRRRRIHFLAYVDDHLTPLVVSADTKMRVALENAASRQLLRLLWMPREIRNSGAYYP